VTGEGIAVSCGDTRVLNVKGMSGETKTQQLSFVKAMCSVGFAVRGPESSLTIVGNPSERFYVGSSEVCALVVRDPMVSRRHLALQATGDHLRVTDLASKNGSTVDGVRIESALLAGGERITLGRTTLDVQRLDNVEVTTPAPDRKSFGKVVGASPAMQKLYPLCDRLAQSNVSVLIEGETGTGKEQLAEALHENGPRALRPFVVFDCTAVPPSLLESELFGYERGAFTGAVTSRAGVFEAADGGTLFIDEIGDLDLTMQPKLLRAIEKLEVRRLGATKATRIDARLIFATRRDLDREVQMGRFRDDLFHRIVVGRIELPPLRQREGDVALLTRAFAKAMGHPENAVPHEALVRWEDSPWPGNVRELRNAVMQLLELGTFSAPRAAEPSTTTMAGLRAIAEQQVASGVPLPVARERVVNELERCYVERLLAQHGGDIAGAVAASGVARRQFFRLKAKLGER
jgi:transcriptional regulator with GAF, ATPase, and Fis domain